jgi:hypothetical protein
MSSFFGNQNSNANPFGNNASNANSEVAQVQVQEVFNELKERVSNLPSSFDYNLLRGHTFNIIELYKKVSSTGKSIFLCDIRVNDRRINSLSAITLLKSLVSSTNASLQDLSGNFKVYDVSYTLDRVTLRKYYEVLIETV